MPLHLPDPLFRGVTSTVARRMLKPILGAGLKDQITRYVVPCAGQFTIPEALVSLGVEPNRITTSDITLFSSVMGYLADPTKSLDALGFHAITPELKEFLDEFPTDSPEQQAAAIFLAIKWVQLDSPKDFFVWQRRSLVAEKMAIHEQFVKALTKFTQKMGGLRYEMKDAFEQVREVQESPETLVWFNPPGYSKGYSKMFAPKGHYKWAEPSIEELDPKRNSEFLESVKDKPVHLLVYIEEGHAVRSVIDGFIPLHAVLNEKKRTKTYILSNKEVDVRATARAKITSGVVPKYQAYDDHTLTDASTVSMIQCTKEEALYYYDLFVRELGMVKSEVYYLFCIDGQVAGTCGFFMRDWRMTRKDYLFETFGLTMTSLRYARLNRLLMMAITCEEFRDQILKEAVKPLLNSEPIKLRTVCLSKYQDLKANRSILKLTHKEQLPNGRWYLVYETLWHKKNYATAVVEWIAKHSSYSRIPKIGAPDAVEA